MTPEERSSEDNALFLCPYCATLIDRDENAYPPERLHQWKQRAYQQALSLFTAPADNSAADSGGGADPRCWPVVQELVRVCLCTYQTQGQVSKNARFRSYAGILYRLLFEDLPEESDYDRRVELWRKAIDQITLDVLESVHCRVARFDGSFPLRYQYLMEELQTYSFQPSEQKSKTLDLIETTVQELFHSGEAFGLAENNAREIF